MCRSPRRTILTKMTAHKNSEAPVQRKLDSRNQISSALYRVLKTEGLSHRYTDMKKLLISYFGEQEAIDIMNNLRVNCAQSLTDNLLTHNLSLGISKLWEFLSSSASKTLATVNDLSKLISSLAAHVPQMAKNLKCINDLLSSTSVVGIIVDILNVYLGFYYRVPWPMLASLVARLGLSFISKPGQDMFTTAQSIIAAIGSDLKRAYERLETIIDPQNVFQVGPITTTGTAFVEFFKSIVGISTYDDRDLTTIIQKMRSQIGLFKDMASIIRVVRSCIESISDYMSVSKIGELDPFVVLTEAEALIPEIGKTQLNEQFGKNPALAEAIPKHHRKLHELRAFFYGLMKDKPEFYHRYLSCMASFSLAMVHIETFKKSHQSRTTPPIVHFYGAPGVGKSRLVRILAHQLHRLVNKLPDDAVVSDFEAYYSRNLNDAFQDAYKSQTVYYFDDPNQNMSTEALVPFLLDIISMGQDTPYQLPMSSVEMKSGGFFNSPFVFLSTNGSMEQVYQLCANHIQDMDAIRRRITYSVEVKCVSRTNSLDDWKFHISKFDGFRNVNGRMEPFYQVNKEVSFEDFRNELMCQLEVNKQQSDSFLPLTKPKNVKIAPIFAQMEGSPSTTDDDSVECDSSITTEEEITDDAYDSEPSVPTGKQSVDSNPSTPIETSTTSAPPVSEEKLVSLLSQLEPNGWSQLTDDEILHDVRSKPYFRMWNDRFEFDLIVDRTTILRSGNNFIAYPTCDVILKPREEAAVFEYILRYTRNNVLWMLTNSESLLYFRCRDSWYDRYVTAWFVPTRSLTPTAMDKKPHWLQCLITALISFWLSYKVFSLVISGISMLLDYLWPTPSRVVTDDAQVAYPKEHATHSKGVLHKPQIKKLNIVQGGGDSFDLISKSVRQLVFCDKDKHPIAGSMLHAIAVRRSYLIYPHHMWVTMPSTSAFLRVYDFTKHEFSYVSIVDALAGTVQIGDDVVLTDFSGKVSDSRDIIRHFATKDQIETLTDDYGKLVKVEFRVPKQPFVEIIAAPLRKVASISYGVAPNEPQEYRLTGGLRFKYPTTGGDCGFPYVCDFKNVDKIVGFHVAGDGRQGSGMIITQNLLQEAIDMVTAGVAQGTSSTKLRLSEPTDDVLPRVTFAPEQNIKVLKVVPRDHASFMPFKSVVTKNETFFDLFTHDPECPELREPTKLRTFINVAGDQIDPVAVAASKLNGVQMTVDPIALDVFKEVAGLYRKTWPLGKSSKIMTIDQALNGCSEFFKPINMKKSAGLNVEPTTKPGKFTFVHCKLCHKSDKCLCPTKQWEMNAEFEHQYSALIAALARGETDLNNLMIVFMDCLKSELRKIAKVQAGKTRIFSAGPFELLVAVRQYFGRFMEMFNANPFEMGSGIGLNPHSPQWKMLYDILSEKPKAIFADAENWDANMIYALIMIVHEEINNWYTATRQKDIKEGLPHVNDAEFAQEQRIRITIAKHTYNTVRIINNVLFVCPGNPSGQALTGIINTLYNNVATRSAVVLVNPTISTTQVFESVRLSATGDDIVVTHDIPGYSCAKHRDAISAYGIKLTPADKSANFTVDNYNLIDGDYLKRRFRVEGSLVFAPLEKLSVLGMVNWRSINMTDRAAAKAVYDCFAIEAMHYGREFYNTHTSIYRDAYAHEYQENLPFRSYDSLVLDFKNSNITYELAQSGGKQVVLDKRVRDTIYTSKAPGTYEGSIRKVGFATKKSEKGAHNDEKVRAKFEGHSVMIRNPAGTGSDYIATPKHDPVRDFRPNAKHRNSLKLPSMPSNPLPPQQPPKRPIAPPVPSSLTQRREKLSAVSDQVLCDELFGSGPTITIADKSFKPQKNKGLKAVAPRPAHPFDKLVAEALAKEVVSIRENVVDLDDINYTNIRKEEVPIVEPQLSTPLVVEVVAPIIVSDKILPKGSPKPEVSTPSETKMTAHKNKQGSGSQRKIQKDSKPSAPIKKRQFLKKEFRPSVPFDHVATRVLNAYNFASYERYKEFVAEHNMFRNEDNQIFGDTSFHYAQNNLTKLTKVQPTFSEKKCGLSYPLSQVDIKVDDHTVTAFGMSPTPKNAQKLACLNAIYAIDDLKLRQVPDYMKTNIKIKSHTAPETEEKNIAQSGYSGQKIPTDDSLEEKANVAIQEDSVSATAMANTKSLNFFDHVNPYLDMTPRDLLSRQILIGSFPITTTSASLVVDLAFPSTGLTYYQTLLNRFTFFHCDFEIESRINSNISQQGLLHWAFVPAYTDRKRHYRTAPVQVLQHVANSDSCTVTIPGLCYNTGFNSFATGSSYDTTRAHQTGNLLCHVLSPIREANVATPVSILMTVYIRLKNVKCYGFRAQSGGTTTIKDLAAALPEKGTVEKERSAKSNSVSAVLDSVSTISSTMSVLPKVGPFASSISALTGLASQVTRYFGHSMSRSVASSTFVNPRSAPMISNSHGTLATDVMALSVDSSLANDEGVIPTQCDYNIYDNIKLIPFALAPFNIGKTTPLGVVRTVNIAPQYMIAEFTEGTNSVQYVSTITDLARSHAKWTGGIKIAAVFVGNRFTNYRMRVYWKPPYNPATPTATQVSDFANRIINVDGPTVASFTIPYLAQQPWLSTQENISELARNCNGQLIFELLTQPQLLGTVDVPSQVFLFVSGAEDLLFSVPQPDYYVQSGTEGIVLDPAVSPDPDQPAPYQFVHRPLAPVTNVPSPNRNMAQSSANSSSSGMNNDLIAHFTTVFPGIIDCQTFVTDRVCMSDVSCSFVERVSRPTYMKTISVTPSTTINPTPVSIDLHEVYKLTSEPQINRHFRRFASHRGSFNLILQPRIQNDVRLIAQYRISQDTTIGHFLVRPFTFGDPLNKPYVAVTVPDFMTSLYRCPLHPETYQDFRFLDVWAYSASATPVTVDVFFSVGDDFSSAVFTGVPPDRKSVV